MDENRKFELFVQNNVKKIGEDLSFMNLSNNWIREAGGHQYAYNFSWLGRPIIQIPQDIYAVQELVWRVKPDLIIETGIAHGGSLIMSASMLALLDYCDAVEAGTVLDPKVVGRKVVGVDIDIRAHNRKAIEAHPMAHKIEMIQGSSIDPEVVTQVKNLASKYKRIMVFLDSNHTHEHVLAELEAYAELTTVGSYCVVWDSGLEDMPEDFVIDRPWGKGNNPKTALLEYLDRCERRGGNIRFEIDKQIEHKIVLSASWDGFLKRID
ncbi:Cephalosporin hydroxylase [Mariprofundus ferrinatatus]|uniref:Cephalosporin hydroxylase n=1 Tax=Mariprofundus ferrinatatus TaxID=1921087 RepID=A0A2K8LFC0_9PROT|nr:cephalosporin hydroxylase family protein [Mariprofundus ferrinatatus]ATX82966.1 Cephalosporin hydroxylase [Mariprofundus ferrinatatus]